MKPSRESGRINLVNKGKHFEVSVYTGGVIDPEEAAIALKRLKSAFPELTDDFHNVLSDMVIEEGFDTQRFKDSINNVIKTCPYPRPAVAEFLSWDKKIELLDYDQYIAKNHELQGQASKYFQSVRLPGRTKPMWARRSDVEAYKLTPWNEENK